MTDTNHIPLYRTIWRWHFHAGLFVIPFILTLSVTGAANLCKPELDRWKERAWRDLPTAGAPRCATCTRSRASGSRASRRSCGSSLPLLAASLLLLRVAERLILPCLPRAARRLGVARG